ncbi:MAG: DUF4162 domain-containing protein [Chloroflexi bacterium]|nr:DUF4162 domain-containing protein [Chloroflexota bacterium]
MAIINQGSVIACDTPRNLMLSLIKDVVYRITLGNLTLLDNEPFDQIQGLRSFHQKLSHDELAVEIILEKDAVLTNVINEIARQSGLIVTLNKRESTLEDVFVKLVGYRMEEVENVPAGQS